MDRKTQELVREHGNWGLSLVPGAGAKMHLVNRSKHMTVCGRTPVSIFGVDIRSQRQVSCLRCQKLGFNSVNAVARYSRIPNEPV